MALRTLTPSGLAALLRALPVLLSVGCAANPELVLSLADATSDTEREEASARAAEIAQDRWEPPAVRLAALRTLGVLAHPAPRTIEALDHILSSTEELPDLRCAAAWALGEMRSVPSLAPLVAALRQPVQQPLASYVLEGVAKHAALLTADSGRLVDAVEAMVFFAGNSRGNPPPIYHHMSERLRSIPINVRVLERSLNALDDSADHQAAAAGAAFDLLASVERSRAEIVASPLEWKVRLEEALRMIHRAMLQGGTRTAIGVVWWLGRLSTAAELALPAAETLTGADNRSDTCPCLSQVPALRFVAAWTFYRQSLFAQASRGALLRDVLPRTLDAAVLKLLQALSPGMREFDALQKIVVSPTMKDNRPRGTP